MLTKMRKLNASGFSLVELMVVVAIIGILAAVAIPNFQNFQRKARTSEARALLGGLYSSMEAFRSEWEEYTGDFGDIGFSPSGALRYNVGFGAIGNVPPAPFVSGGSGVFVTTGNCGAAPLNNCTDNSGGEALPAAVANPAANTFTAGAAADLGGTQPDHWTMDQQKTLVNQQNGTTGS